jgi:uncharacterized membrane protein
MKTMIFGLGLGLLLLLQASQASASVKMCNKSGREIWATWGETSQGGADGNIQNDHASGWYHLNPGECKTPISGCICNVVALLANNCFGKYLFFAKDANGATWSNGSAGTVNVCTTFNAFNENPLFNYEGRICQSGRQWLPWGKGKYPEGAFCDYTFNFLP